MSATVYLKRGLMPKPSRKVVVMSTLCVCLAAIGIAWMVMNNQGEANHQPTNNPKQFNGQHSYNYLKDICKLGPRPSGSEAMAQQRKILKDHFQKLGGHVLFQDFSRRHPQTGENVKMRNMVVHWHKERQDRILLCAHYDTRPFPDEDRRNPKGVFIGANDGASGVALLAELAHLMPGLNSHYGVDFVLFDAEEFIFDAQRDRNLYFLGSTYFASWYKEQPPKYRYRFGVLLDMVADKNLKIYQEKNSLRYAKVVVKSIWKTARRLKIREFVHRSRHEIRDDHIPLNKIAKIPTCDIIDFDYPKIGSRRTSYWHTTKDVPSACSAQSLGKVGTVIYEWLKTVDKDKTLNRLR